jgi:hypothetical protein
MARRAAIARSMTLAAVTLAVAGGTVLGAVRDGTDGADTLVGTHKADTFDGKVGDDLLKGLGGNDLYHFRPNSGHDTIQERTSHKVGDKQVPGGTDAVSFADVTGSRVQIWLVPEWGRRYNRATRSEEYTVEFGTSPIENATGTGVGSDELYGGGGANVLHPGRAGNADFDRLSDFGGWREGADGRPGLPASNDRYTGFAEHGGRVYVQDWGGAADVLDLRPLALTDVRVERVDVDETPEELESLQITERDGSGVVVLGHFGEWRNDTAASGQRGRIEKLVFADGTFDAAKAASLTAASAKADHDGKGANLATAAERLTAEAQEDLRTNRAPASGGADFTKPDHGDATVERADRSPRAAADRDRQQGDRANGHGPAKRDVKGNGRGR